MLSLPDFQPVFSKNKKNKRTRVFKNFSKKTGCYIIKENGVIVYVGMSRHCIVKACYRHFYIWTDTRGDYRITYVKNLDIKLYTIAMIETEKEEAPELEKALIFHLKPRDNRQRHENYIENFPKSEVTMPTEFKNDIITNSTYDYEPF